MNLPVGVMIEQGISFEPGAFLPKVLALMNEKFSGYIAITIEGYDGIEDSALVFRSGSIAAAFHEYMKYNILVLGNFAVPQAFNAAGAKNNSSDIVALGNQQIDLVLAFNDKARVSKNYAAKDINALAVSTYSSSYAEKVLSEVLKSQPSKYDVMKKLGLSELK
ncbi:MAG: hypothetical protein WC602_06585 [archaeon]